MKPYWFVLLLAPVVSRAQTPDSIRCADVRNGTFYSYDRQRDVWSTMVRKAGTARETFGKTLQPILWEVTWQSDCVCSYKYLSGGDDRPDNEKKYREKHVIVEQILQATPDFVVVRYAADKVGNPTLNTDTVWIKIRQADKGKPVTNPRADSLVAARKKLQESIDSTYATLYVYRPHKTLNMLLTYNLLVDGQPVCVISNGCRIKIKLKRMGTFHISAKVNGKESHVDLNAEPGKDYYLQCQALWGFMKSDPALLVEDPVKGKVDYNSGY